MRIRRNKSARKLPAIRAARWSNTAEPGTTSAALSCTAPPRKRPNRHCITEKASTLDHTRAGGNSDYLPLGKQTSPESVVDLEPMFLDIRGAGRGLLFSAEDRAKQQDYTQDYLGHAWSAEQEHPSPISLPIRLRGSRNSSSASDHAGNAQRGDLERFSSYRQQPGAGRPDTSSRGKVCSPWATTGTFSIISLLRDPEIGHPP